MDTAPPVEAFDGEKNQPLSAMTNEALFKMGKEAVTVDEKQLEVSSKPLVVAASETGKVLVETRKEAVPIYSNQTEKSKQGLVEAGAAMVDTAGNQTESCSESDPPPLAGVNGMHELSDDLVGFILAMPRETSLEDIPFMTGKYNNLSDEWIEEQRRWFKEDAARDQEIRDDFVLFQDWVRGQYFDNGYVEVDEECLNQVAELEQYSRELWDDWVNSGGLDGLEFADPSDPRCAVSY